MFTGKGGVGKTTCSAAAALHYAADGRTLVISTDATPSLSHIFEITDKQKPAGLPSNLEIREIVEHEIRQMWDAKFGREVYEVFSAFVDIEYEEFVEFMTSILPGLGEEFMVDHIRELCLSGDYSNIVWDTAPLGQTLSLLETPALLAEHLRLAPRIYSKLKFGNRSKEPVLEILKRWQKLSAANMDFLRRDVDFTMVTIPEALAVAQLEGTLRELEKYGLSIKQIIINNVVKIEDSLFLQTKSRQQRPYLKQIHEKYHDLKITELPLFPQEIKGIVRLKELGKILF
ncbi:MAG: ArsA family ATPase [Dehalococcoidales bacterium]|nr:ArsA family ATPase [Dehalococcoidales bacterium]